MAVLLYTPLSKPPSSAEEDRAEGMSAGVRRDSVGGTQGTAAKAGPCDAQVLHETLPEGRTPEGL